LCGTAGPAYLASQGRLQGSPTISEGFGCCGGVNTGRRITQMESGEWRVQGSVCVEGR
jgi:hypothetical protein